jgi:hypothetical protein
MALTENNIRVAVHQPLFKDEELLGELMAIRVSTSDARLQGYVETALSFLRPRGIDAPPLLALCAYRLRSNLKNTATGAPSATLRARQQETVALLPQHLHERFSFSVPL